MKRNDLSCWPAVHGWKCAFSSWTFAFDRSSSHNNSYLKYLNGKYFKALCLAQLTRSNRHWRSCEKNEFHYEVKSFLQKESLWMTPLLIWLIKYNSPRSGLYKSWCVILSISLRSFRWVQNPVFAVRGSAQSPKSSDIPFCLFYGFHIEFLPAVSAA